MKAKTVRTYFDRKKERAVIAKTFRMEWHGRRKMVVFDLTYCAKRSHENERYLKVNTTISLESEHTFACINDCCVF